MTTRNFEQPTCLGGELSPAGACTGAGALRMVTQRDGSRVSAAGDAR